MDMKKAWKKFEETGKISYYLEFCKYKNMEDTICGKELKSKGSNNS